MNEPYISPNAYSLWGYNDSKSIQNAIDYASKTGINRVVIPRKNARTGESRWVISESILLPSHMTVILDNCYLILADGSYCNFFRNANFGGHTLAEEQCDITIRGEGYPILDGGKPNSLAEGFDWQLSVQQKDSSGNVIDLGIRINNMIVFHNVRDFVIENLEVRNQRWHAMDFLYCRYGRIANITCKATNVIPNQDLMNLALGCNHFVIERINGQSADDLIAINVLMSSDYLLFVEGKDDHVHDVVIRDVIGTSVANGLVVLRNQDDYQIYNVEIENILESDMEDKNNNPYTAICLGQNGYRKKKESPMGSTRNINVTTVMSDNASTIQTAATLQDCSLRNIRCLGGRYAICSFGTKMQNVKIDGVYVAKKELKMPLRFVRRPYSGKPIELGVIQRDDDYLENVEIVNVISENGPFEVGLKAGNRDSVTLEGVEL